MKPIFKKVDSKSEEAFVARIDQFAQFYNKWHFHPELELTHIVKGRGTRFVGDNIEFFQAKWRIFHIMLICLSACIVCV